MTPDRSPTRRARARRFSLAGDARWERLQRAVLAGGAAAAIVALLLQAGMADGLGSWTAIALATLTGAALPARAAPPAVLRWDGGQWWWQCAGEPLAVTPEVVIDLEQWMLLRLTPSTDGLGVHRGRRPERWIAVSRRALGPQWVALRFHLFLATG